MLKIAEFLAKNAALLVSLIGLSLALRAEYRSQRRFTEQLELTKELAMRSMRPLLHISRNAYEDDEGLFLTNFGVGTAAVTHMQCTRGRKKGWNPVDVVELDRDIDWVECPDYEDVTFYIRPGATEPLIHLTDEHLEGQGVALRERRKLLKKLSVQLDELKIELTYKDVLGNVVAENFQLHP